MDPWLGTNPPTAFMSVDLPAPLVPMSPTISPLLTVNHTSSTATFPPKATDSADTESAGTPGSVGTSLLRKPCG